jgi:2-oxo-3-hexenedioate decarboxylase
MSGGGTARIADELMDVLGSGRSVGRFPGLRMAEAYAVAAEIRARREARGERVVGRKIGFTNSTIWPLYGVSAPMWNFIYDSTVHDLDAVSGGFDLRGLAEPRIEPEIVLGLAAAPVAGMSDEEILGCVEWVAHGFEIVQSVYPGWKLTGPESAAAFGLHGALLIGPRHTIGAYREQWGDQLRNFTLTLRKGGPAVGEGVGTNVLGGPIQALRFLLEEIARYPGNAPVAAGEIVTTGTLTDAQPALPGDEWSTELAGIPLAGITLRFASG